MTHINLKKTNVYIILKELISRVYKMKFIKLLLF